jgi:hypothetical protein
MGLWILIDTEHYLRDGASVAFASPVVGNAISLRVVSEKDARAA